MNSALLLVLFLAVSFLLSGMETGVFALNRLRVRHLMRTGNRRAALLHRYLEAPERFLWTIMVGNILATLGAIGTVFMLLLPYLGGRPAWFFAALLGAALLFYLTCELLPKMLFRIYPTRLCLMMVWPFRFVDGVLRPLVTVLEVLANALLRLTGGQRFTGRLFGNREAFRSFVQEASPGLTKAERIMISRVLDLQHLTAREVTVPMHRVISIEADAPLEAFLDRVRQHGYSRMPVWETGKGQRRVAGIVSLRPLIYEPDLPLDKPVGAFSKPALYLDEDLRLDEALRRMQQGGHHLAIVLAADQSELGILTLHDILQVVFGGLGEGAAGPLRHGVE